LRLFDQGLDAFDEPLADTEEGARLLAARVESELLQQDASKRRLGAEPAVVHAEDGDQLLEERLVRARRRERHVGNRVQLLVEDEEHEVALVLGIVEERAEADVRALRDLAHGGGAVTVTGEELRASGADALTRLELLSLAAPYPALALACHTR